MKTEIKIPVRSYLVKIKDTRTGERITDTIVLDKSRLQAGALFDLGDEDIICRIYNRQGFRVLEIGKPVKADLTVDLLGLFRMERLQAFGKARTDAQPDNQEVEACDAE